MTVGADDARGGLVHRVDGSLEARGHALVGEQTLDAPLAILCLAHLLQQDEVSEELRRDVLHRARVRECARRLEERVDVLRGLRPLPGGGRRVKVVVICGFWL